MKDVARACGFSQAAVSLAMRGDRSIPEKTRQEITQAARKLGYRTSPLVSALMSLHRQRRSVAGATTVIAYLASHPPHDPWRSRSFFVNMFDGARERAAEIGCRLEEFGLHAAGMTPARLREIFRARNIHGAIVGPLPYGETALDFNFTQMAVVGLGMSVTKPVIERVASDHFQSVVLAVDRCVALGYRRIGLVLSHESSRRLDHRWRAGYRFAIEQNNLPRRLEPLMTELQGDLAGALPQWLRTQRPDVVILGNAEYELQMRVPTTVGLVSLGVDKLEGPLTGIYQDYRLLGSVTAEHAIAKLYTNNFGPLEVAHLHLVAGRWAAGVSAPGPKKHRPTLAVPATRRTALY